MQNAQNNFICFWIFYNFANKIASFYDNCTSQQKVDTNLWATYIFMQRSTLYTVWESGILKNKPAAPH